jgi:hypothetical protein
MLLDEHGMAMAVIGSWGGTNFYCNLGPGQAVPLPVVIPTNSTKFRISFGYSKDANPVQKMLCPLCRNLFQPARIPVPQKIIARLSEQGWLDGRLHFNYEGRWEADQ